MQATMPDSVLLTVVLPVVNLLIMCGIGLTLRLEDFLALYRQPRAVLVGMAGHYLLLPLLGFGAAWLLRDTPALALGFVVLAACPSATVSNALSYLAGGNMALAVSLTGISAVVSFFTIPLLVRLALAWLEGTGTTIQLPLLQGFAQLAVLMLLPLLAGMALHRFAPRLAQRIEPWVAPLTLPALLAIVAMLLYHHYAFLGEVVGRLGAIAMAMCMAAIAGGIALGRLARLPHADCATLGMEVGIQNCSLALLVALQLLHTPEAGLPAIAYGLLMLLPGLATVRWMRWRAGSRAARGVGAGRSNRLPQNR